MAILLIRMVFKYLTMKTLSCREAGFDCDYVVKGETEEEVMKNGGEHAMKVHGMKTRRNNFRNETEIKRAYSPLLIIFAFNKNWKSES